jgi:hypothetical protein
VLEAQILGMGGAILNVIERNSVGGTNIGYGWSYS